MVINPRAIKNSAGARLQRAKTDPVDARLILDFIQRMDFVPWKPPLDEGLQLQAITRGMNQLKSEATHQANHLKAEGCRPNPTGLIERDIQVQIRHLQRPISRCGRRGHRAGLSVAELSEKFHHLLLHLRHGPTQCA